MQDSDVPSNTPLNQFDLIRISAFNIEARYPDMKRNFRRTCTPEYTDQQMAAIKEMFAWLRSQQA